MSDVHDGRTHSLNPPFTRIAAMFVRMLVCVCLCVCVWVCGSDKPRQSNSYSRACGNYVCRYVKWTTWSWLHCALQCDAMQCNAMQCVELHCTLRDRDSHVAPEAIIKFIAWKWAELRCRAERQTGKLTNRLTDKLSVYLPICLPVWRPSAAEEFKMRWDYAVSCANEVGNYYGALSA